MKKAIIFICILGVELTLHSQPRHFAHDDSFTRHYVHQHYSPSYELRLFTSSWGNLMNNYLSTVSFSNRLSSISSFDFSTSDPEVLLSAYYEKINQLNANFAQQQEENNAMIDQGVRDLGELAANVARNNNITTKNPLADFLIKEVAIGTVQERTKQKNAEKLEIQRSQVQASLESNLSKEMGEIRDQMLSENSQLRDRYLEAMAYEADNAKESYYGSCYDYYECFVEQIRSRYAYNSPSWYRTDCVIPKEEYSTSIKSEYVDIAFRKLNLYSKYNNEMFLNATNIFLDASLSENKQNPKAYFLKSQLEKDIIDKMFFATVAVTLDPANNEYRTQLGEITNSFNDDFFTAIRNGKVDFISRSIEKDLQLGREYNNRTAIETAIDYDKSEILIMLLNSIPEEKNAFDKNGKGLLFHACAVDALDVVKTLISLGLNPEARDKSNSGLTALNIAVENNSQKVTAYLASNYNIKPALLYAKKSGSDDLAYISSRIYEAAPEKLADIKSVYSKFNPNQLADKITPEMSRQTDNEIVDSSNNNLSETNNVEKQSDLNENTSGSLNSGSSDKPDIETDSNSKESFKSDYGIFTDLRDGKEYQWVKINNQIWMSENLAYIPSDEGAAWIYETEINDLDAVNNSLTYKAYGVLYSYQTAIKSCPSGWRVPSDLEWSKLENFLDNTVIDLNQIGYRGTTVASKLVMTKPGSLKVNFGGKRMSNGKFIGIENIGSFWTSTNAENSKAWNRQIQKNLPQTIRTKANENEGNSLRCLKK